MPVRIAVLCFAVCLATTCRCQQDTGTVITLEHTACYGMCAVYSLQINSDGEVQYKGDQYVAVTGKRTAKITELQVRKLLDDFAKINYFGLKDSYAVGPDIVADDGSVTRSWRTTDLPTTYIGLTQNGQTKRIEDYEYAPDELRRLEVEIERVVNSHQWLHDQHNRLTLESPELGRQLPFIDDLKNEPIVSGDVGARTKPGMTKLMQAAGTGDTKSVQEELQFGADVNVQDATGWTALMLASVEGKEDLVRLLLKCGARIELRDNHGDNALIGAAANPYLWYKPAYQVGVINALIAAGATVDTANQRGETPLMWAAKSGSPEVVSALLHAGADPRHADKNGRIAVFYVRRVLAEMGDDVRKQRFEDVVSLLDAKTHNQKSAEITED